jgi:hypothetical protein
MFSTYLAGLAGSLLASKGLECGPSGSAKSTRSARKSSLNTGQMSLVMETSAPLQPETSEPDPMSLPAASPAKTFHLSARVLVFLERAAGYGKNTPDLLARYDPTSSSWKTSQLCLVEGLATFSETWPRSGMMRNGIAYQLPPLVPATDETESGLWPTPSARDWKDTPGMARQAGDRDRTDQLARAVYATENSLPGSGTLNPTWVEWLMAFPIGWTDLNHSVTQSSRGLQKSSGGQS